MEPTRLEAVGCHLTSIQKLFVDFEHVRVLICGDYGGHRLCLS